jgi:hypothetical protein
MVDSVLGQQAAGEVLESLRRTALAYVNRNQRKMRLSLQIPARGQRCRLFYGHGPVGFVIERGTVNGKPIVVAEFDAVLVLNEVMARLSVG